LGHESDQEGKPGGGEKGGGDGTTLWARVGDEEANRWRSGEEVNASDHLKKSNAPGRLPSKKSPP